MAEPEWITLPEVNVGPITRPRRRRPRVRGIDDDEPAAPSAPAVELAPELGELGAQTDRMRERLGITPTSPAAQPDARPQELPTPTGAPRVLGLDDEEATGRARIESGLSTLSPMQRMRVQGIDLPDAEDSPASTQAILGAIGQEQRGMPIPPRTQLPEPRVAPPAAPRLGVLQPTRPMPYVAGLDEETDDTESPDQYAVPNATGGNVGGAMEPRAKSARPIPGVQPDPLDQMDQAEAQRMARARRGLGIAGIVSALFGDSATNDQRTQALQGAADVNDPRIPLDRMAQRQAAQREAALEAEDLAFRRANEERRAALEDRRIAQAEGATAQNADREAALYDPEHPAAQSARVAYARLYRAIPPQALGQLSSFAPSADMRGMSAHDVRQQGQSLMSAWARLQQANPRLFAVGRRGGGTRTADGRLGLTLGTSRGRDYGTSQGLTAEDYAALGIEPPPEVAESVTDDMGAPPMAAPPAVSGGGVPRARSTGAAPARAPAAQGAAGPAPEGRPVWERTPTLEEMRRDPRLAAQERLTEAAARRLRVDINTPEGRYAAAGMVNEMGDRAVELLASEGARTRTDQEQQQVNQYVNDYGPMHAREEQLQGLQGALARVLRSHGQEAGQEIIRAALHARGQLTGPLSNLNSEVTRIRAMFADFFNAYAHTYGGANVTDSEMRRYMDAFAAGSITASPSEFVAAIERARAREHAALNQGAIRYPDGSRIYNEERAAQRQAERAARRARQQGGSR